MTEPIKLTGELPAAGPIHSTPVDAPPMPPLTPRQEALAERMTEALQVLVFVGMADTDVSVADVLAVAKELGATDNVSAVEASNLRESNRTLLANLNAARAELAIWQGKVEAAREAGADLHVVTEAAHDALPSPVIAAIARTLEALR